MIAIKKSSIKYRDLIRIFSNLRSEQIKLFIFCALSIVSDTLLTYQVQGLVDSIVNKVEFQGLLRVFYRILFWSILSFALTVYQTYRWHTFRYSLINLMRTRMYKSLLKKDISFFDNNDSGDLASKVMNDGTSIAENAGIQILMIILNVFRILIVIVILISFNLKLGLAIIPILPIYGLMLLKANGKMRGNALEERKVFAEVQQNVLEDINGIKEIKMFNKYNYFTKMFDDLLNNKYFKAVKKIIRCQVLTYALNNMMTIFLPTLILIFGAYLAYKGEVSIGTLVAFYTYLAKLIEPLGNLADSYQGSRMALGSADRVHDFIFDNKTEEDREVFKDEFKNLNINIESFSWKDKQIINKLKLDIHKGDRINIKGDSGKGKSTLLKLIMDYYENYKGYILLNETDIRRIRKEDLYGVILQLHQEPFIFEGTIKDNLTLGDSYLESDLNEIIEVSCMKDFVQDKGLNYVLNEGGSNISGGQKQRLALARVLLRKPQVLILDEATSALDGNTEKQLVQNLKEYLIKNEITLICVSHNKEIGKICNKVFEL